MKAVVYRLVAGISRWIGGWFLSLFARIVAAGYYLLFPDRVRESARVYRALFPGKSTLFIYGCVWRQFQRFTGIYLDRMLLSKADDISIKIEGWEALEECLNRDDGAILLMSHLGNWDIAAHLLRKRQPGIQLLLYIGTKEGEQLEKLQKKGLMDEGIKVIAVDQNGASPFQLIEANTFMSEGGLVSLTGDRIWHESQRTIAVDFLGHEVLLPESPHLLAMLSEKPLFALFPVKKGKRRFHIHICPPIVVKAKNRAGRKEAVRQSAQTYAGYLADAARRDPYEWFHFEPFLGKKIGRKH